MNRLKSIKHIGIYVRNLECMVNFYQNGLGFLKLVEYQDTGTHLEKIFGVSGVILKICKLLTPFGKKNGSGDMIELIAYDSEVPDYSKKLYTVGTAHIALEVEDIYETYEAVVSAGGFAVVEPMQVQESGNYMAFCRDPEGNYLELIQRG